MKTKTFIICADELTIDPVIRKGRVFQDAINRIESEYIGRVLNIVIDLTSLRAAITVNEGSLTIPRTELRRANA
jgi:hypothetical protein